MIPHRKKYIPIQKILWNFSIISPIVFILGVTLIGFMTPGYNHLRHTISRLSIEQYGWIENINLFQLALAMCIAGILVSRLGGTPFSKAILSTTLFSNTILCIATILFPTDPIEEVQFTITQLSLNGMMHVGVLFIFVLASPIGIVLVSKILRKEFKNMFLANLTLLCGVVSFVLSVVWGVSWLTHTGDGFLGVFQKVITLISIFWLEMLLLHMRKISLKKYER